MLETLESMVAQWRINPNLDLPAVSHTRYSRRALAGQLARIVR
jgi:hypothetical protein